MSTSSKKPNVTVRKRTVKHFYYYYHVITVQALLSLGMDNCQVQQIILSLITSKILIPNWLKRLGIENYNMNDLLLKKGI